MSKFVTKENLNAMYQKILPYLGGNSQDLKYSTSEKAVGTWIDGKTIYQKTFNFGSLTSTNTEVTKSLDMGVAVDNFIRLEGMVRSGSDPWQVALPYSLGSNNKLYILAAGQTNPNNKINIHYNGYAEWVTDVVVTAYYTKV